MRIVLNKILMGCCLVFLQTYVIGQSAVSCDDAKLIVSNFVINRTSEGWDRLEVGAYKWQDCKCEMAPVFYYIYRMKVLLPNSQALLGISPSDFISSQKLKMCEQVKILKSCEKKIFSPLIKAMAKQDFDTEIAETAKDLNIKLDQIGDYEPMGSDWID